MSWFDADGTTVNTYYSTANNATQEEGTPPLGDYTTVNTYYTTVNNTTQEEGVPPLGPLRDL